MFGFLAGTFTSLWAQNRTYLVSGMVVEEETDNPVELCTILIDSLKTGTQSNLDGAFTFNLPPGSYELKVEALGFEPFKQRVVVKDADVTGLLFKISSQSTNVDVVEIIGGENPANRIIRGAAKNRNKNRIDHLESYQYEAYNKTTITMNNISKEKLNGVLLRPAKKFVNENEADTGVFDMKDSVKKFKIGLYIYESISEMYYKKPVVKEKVLATKTNGVQSLETNFVEGLLKNCDIYDNYFNIVDKEFLSPIAPGALMNYKFYITDTIIEGVDSLVGMIIKPKRDFDRVFKGKIYIELGSFAVRKVDMSMNKDPNINFVEDIRIRQEFKRVDGEWMPVVKDIIIDFKNKEDKVGMVGRTVTFMDKYELSKPKDDKFYKGEISDIAKDADKKDSTFWATRRLNPLERSDTLAYKFIDQLKKTGAWQMYLTILDVISKGKKTIGPVDIGPYAKIISWNKPEGIRLQIGVFTNERFHPRLYLGGHIAYAFKDKRIKYDAEVRYKLRLSPRIEIAASRSQEIEQTGFRNYDVDGTGVLNSILMRAPLRRLNYYQQNVVSIRGNLTRGITGMAYIKTRSFEPVADEFFYWRYNAKDGHLKRTYSIAETGCSFRFSIKENYTLKKGERIYTGSKFPQLYLDYTYGFKGLLGSSFQYHKAEATLSHKWRLGRFGWMNYTATVGKIFGTLPYPSLYVFKGSQSFAFDPNGYYVEALSGLIGSRNRSSLYDGVGFNLMYFYEFVADQYLVAGLDHHFEGYVFNKIPGVRWLTNKLKWKEVFTFRLAYGSVSKANKEMNEIQNHPEINPMQINNLIHVQAPNKIPYMEIGTGVENILKFLRVDFVWRLTYKDPHRPVGFKDWFDFNFGIRLYAYIAF